MSSSAPSRRSQRILSNKAPSRVIEEEKKISTSIADEEKKISPPSNSSLKKKRVGLDSVEVFDSLDQLRFINFGARLQFSDFQETKLSERIKTRVMGQSLQNFLEHNGLKAFRLGRIRFSEIDLELRALVHSSRIEVVTDIFNKVIKKTGAIENQKVSERYVHRAEFNALIQDYVSCGFY